MSPKLVYQPLAPSGKNIRLLLVHPAARLDDRLNVTIHHAGLDESVYSALSYVWGDQERNRSEIDIAYEVTLSKRLFTSRKKRPPKLQRFEIGSNLGVTLRHLRRQDKPITIWADALCINQEDKEERSWQVELMVKIYSHARQVFAFLGPQYDDNPAMVNQIHFALDLTGTIWTIAQGSANADSLQVEESWFMACFAAAEPDTYRRKNVSDLGIEERKGVKIGLELHDKVLSDRPLRDALSSMRALSWAPYFSRIWILQESGRARDLVFRYGPREISYRSLFLALCLASSVSTAPGSSRMNVDGARQFDKFDMRFYGCLAARATCTKGRSIQQVLEVAYFAMPLLHQAKEPQDYIYGRLGLAYEQNDIKVNYKLGTERLYVETSRYLLEKGFMDLLTTFKPYDFLRGGIHKTVPSWTYDWTTKGRDTFTVYEASRGKKPRILFTGPSRQALTMTGVHIGNVRMLGRRFSKVVQEAGLGQGSIALASLQREPYRITTEQMHDLVNSLSHAYKQLGINDRSADQEQLFSERRYPVLRFWCWWVTWIADLHHLMQMTNSQLSTHDIGELLFREAFRTSKNTRAFREISKVASLSQLVNLQHWLRILSFPGDTVTTNDGRNPYVRDTLETSLDRDAPAAQSALNTPFATTSSGISFAEICFTSAWGMRFAMLDSQRIGYVPEDTGPNDQVVIFHGVKAPLVIRQVVHSDALVYKIVGPVYICGAMHGQLMDVGLSERKYTLI